MKPEDSASFSPPADFLPTDRVFEWSFETPAARIERQTGSIGVPPSGPAMAWGTGHVARHDGCFVSYESKVQGPVTHKMSGISTSLVFERSKTTHHRHTGNWWRTGFGMGRRGSNDSKLRP